MFKITSRFTPSIVKAAIALETAVAYFERRDCCDYDEATKWHDADAGVQRNMQIWRDAKNGYHAPGATADDLVAQCMFEMQSNRRKAAQDRKARRIANELAREERLMTA